MNLSGIFNYIGGLVIRILILNEVTGVAACQILLEVWV